MEEAKEPYLVANIEVFLQNSVAFPVKAFLGWLESSSENNFEIHESVLVYLCIVSMHIGWA